VIHVCAFGNVTKWIVSVRSAAHHVHNNLCMSLTCVSICGVQPNSCLDASVGSVHWSQHELCESERMSSIRFCWTPWFHMKQIVFSSAAATQFLASLTTLLAMQMVGLQLQPAASHWDSITMQHVPQHLGRGRRTSVWPRAHPLCQQWRVLFIGVIHHTVRRKRIQGHHFDKVILQVRGLASCSSHCVLCPIMLLDGWDWSRFGSSANRTNLLLAVEPVMLLLE